MLKLSKKIKAFTLVEIFIAMMVLSVLVTLCISFFSRNQQKDLEREYYYYSAYQNIVRVVDAALANNSYRILATPRTEATTCAGKKCVVIRNVSGNLCNIFVDYFNKVGSANCSASTSNPENSSATPALTLTNGMQFFFKNQNSETLPELYLETEPLNGYGWTVWVDINGKSNGKNQEHYDIMKFYVTRTGKVIPAYGKVTGVRDYYFTPADLDAAGNKSLMAFDVVYTPQDSNVLTVLNDATRHTDFRTAACVSGYINQEAPYCKAVGSSPAITKNGDICAYAWANCEVRLVKKLKRAR